MLVLFMNLRGLITSCDVVISRAVAARLYPHRCFELTPQFDLKQGSSCVFWRDYAAYYDSWFAGVCFAKTIDRLSDVPLVARIKRKDIDCVRRLDEFFVLDIENPANDLFGYPINTVGRYEYRDLFFNRSQGAQQGARSGPDPELARRTVPGAIWIGTSSERRFVKQDYWDDLLNSLAHRVSLTVNAVHAPGHRGHRSR